MNVIYEGFFVKPNVELESKLEKDIEFKHITTQFKPEKSHEDLYGIEVNFIATKYGNDGINEGYKVKALNIENNELLELYNQIPNPHITLSVSKDGKPVNTSKLNFEPIGEEIIIPCIFGGFIGKPIYNN